MDSKFLDNIQVEGNPLPPEIKQILLEEHSRGIEKIKKQYSDYDTIKEQLAAANKTIEDFKGMDIDGVKKAAEEWKQKSEQAERDAAQRIADMEFDNDLKDAIKAAKGKNVKAISALLDIPTLKQSKNRAEDLKTAIENVQKKETYLFGEDQTPPPYAPGAGSQNMGNGSEETFHDAIYNRIFQSRKDD